MTPRATTKELRSFGLVMAAAFGILATLGIWKATWSLSAARIALYGAGAIFALLGLAAPATLRWPHRIWMAFGEVLGAIMGTLILSVFFFVILTPTGLLRRLFGADPMGAKPRPEGEGYWKKRPEDPRGKERYEQTF